MNIKDPDFSDIFAFQNPTAYQKILETVNERLNYRWGEFPYGGHLVHYPFMNRVHMTVRYLTGWDRDMFKYVLSFL